MGVFDWLPCCGPRSRLEKDNASTAESAALIPPHRPDSIISADGPIGYGAVDHAPQGGLTGEQRARIEEIGREVGNSMLPIHTNTRSPHLKTSAQAAGPSVPSSSASSRPSSPSPMRPGSSPPGGVMTPEHSDDAGSARVGREESSGGVSRTGGADKDEVEVVQKRLFVGGNGGRKPNRGRGRGRARGRGK